MSSERLLYAFRRNLVVAASAGTGKTHRLTALYTLLLLGLTSWGREGRAAAPPLLPSRIVATTFSRAAALEILGRVERTLRALADGDGHLPFQAEIQLRLSELDDPPTLAALRENARRALVHFPDAKIQTFHSLAVDLLRRHALSFGVSPSFRLASEDLAREIAESTIDRVLSEHLRGSTDDVLGAQALIGTMGDLGRTRAALLPFFDRLSDDGLCVKDLALEDALGFGRGLRFELARVASEATQAKSLKVREAADVLVRAMSASPEDLALSPPAEEALRGLLSVRLASDPKTEPLAAFLAGLGRGTKEEKAQKIISTLADCVLADRENPLILRVLEKIELALRSDRIARGELTFGDTLSILHSGLRDKPALRRDVASEIDVLMVDEFQDTNRIQKELVYLLRSDPEDLDAMRPAGLFIVGDRKQSIYGFRGANVEVFNQVAVELSGRAAAEELGLSPPSTSSEGATAKYPPADFVALRQSYRSHARLLEFINAFASEDFGASYGPGEHLMPVRDEPARAALEPGAVFVTDAGTVAANDSSGEEGRPASTDLGLSGAKAEASSQKVASLDEAPRSGAPDATENLRREARLAARFAAYAHARGYGYRDIAVLVRRRRTIPYLELALGELGLPFVVAGRALFESTEVLDLFALLSVIVRPTDRFALAALLRGPLLGLSEQGLVALSDERGLRRDVLSAGSTVTWDAHQERRLARFRTRFAAVRPGLLRLPPHEALAKTIAIFELDVWLAGEPRASERLGNLDRLVDLARGRGRSLAEFVGWLSRQIKSQEDELEAVVFSNEDDAIRVATIHGSKGLDFPVTIVMDLAAREQSRPANVKHVTETGAPTLVLHRRVEGGFIAESPVRLVDVARQKEDAIAERRRLSYVAFTRARDVLALIDPGPRTRQSAIEVLDRVDPSRFRRMLAEELSLAAAPIASKASPSRYRVLPDPPVPSAPRRLVMAPTPLSVFRECPRRFRFRFQLGLEEPVDSGQLDLLEASLLSRERRVEPFESPLGVDPRERGREAHRVLERIPRPWFGAPPPTSELVTFAKERGVEAEVAETLGPLLTRLLLGGWARLVARARSLHREEEQSVFWRGDLDLDLGLRGTVDAFAVTDDRVALVDYKLGGSGVLKPAYEFQLRAYGLALSKRFPDRPIAMGIVALSDPDEPRWIQNAAGLPLHESRDFEPFAEEVRRTLRDFFESRRADRWASREPAECRTLRCGFITACHRRA